MNLLKPLATLRLSADRLDTNTINGIMLSDGGLSDVRTKADAWLITTEDYPSLIPQDHLDKVTGMLADHIHSIRQAFPGVVVAFSLLVFDPDFDPLQLPRAATAAATEFGRLTIELPRHGSEFVFDGQTILEHAA